ncbi:hypothetical protein FRX31_035127, partial [Thalictrum thalictroides]
MLSKLYESVTVKEWLESWPARTGNTFMVKVWSYLPYATTYVIRKNRNRKVFNDVVPNMIMKMKQEIKVLIWFWCGNWPGRKAYNFTDLTGSWEGVLAGTILEDRAAT